MASQVDFAFLQAQAQNIRDELVLLYSSLQLPAGVDITVSRDSLLHHWFPVSICAAALFGIILYTTSLRRSRARARRAPETRKALQTLLYILTPTCSLWPASYVKLAQQAVTVHDTTLRFPLRALVDDVLSGRIELRDPRLDLPDLLRNEFRVDGWTFGLSVERAWWVDVLGWTLSAQLAPPKTRQLIQSALSKPLLESIPNDGRTSRQQGYMPAQAPPPEHDVLPRLPTMASAIFPPTVSLDDIAYTLMETSIKDLQSSLVPGSSLTLIFTTTGTSASFPSSNFVLAALPFLPHSRSSPSSKNQKSPAPRRGRWAPAPLFSSMPQIVQLLTSGPNSLAVDSILNISDACASSLHAYVQDLEDNRVAVEKFVQQRGVTNWRAERFFASWEAACLTNKLLERWAVIVRR
ncbi:uncharacterized protein B0H18DRAFT_1209327 [Fomitopsis serialis]|uniref:uncharacterized protein n=1 Tax=Fomitopsis serialis TaxID=139415 RepID=UPI0020083439|nr:uncharacterized protein B0H18DRAFT_1209327 [Neoantrodia serialis]KAH9930756.1 hypothetical protein B0H18DRAFT_1209327 [Neoantrodia serialis]